MTTPANLDFTAIQTRVMNELRLRTDNTTDQPRVAAVINLVYRDICAKSDWFWLQKRYVFNTNPKIDTGTVSVTQNSTGVTFSTTPQRFSSNADVTGDVLFTPGQADDPSAAYKISMFSTPGGTSATLDAPYTGATNATGAFRLYTDAYPLPSDAGKILLVKRFGESLPCQKVGIEEMSQYKLNNQNEGRPEAWSVFDYQTTGDPTQSRLLQIHPYPDKAYRLEVFYKQSLNTELSSTVQPMIPDDYRQVLIYGALARCYPIFLNDTERGGFFQSLFNDILSLMTAQQREYASDRTGVKPDMNPYRDRWTRRRPRTAYTLGNLFDTWSGWNP